MEYFEGLDFFGTLFFALIPVILLRLFEKSVYWITFVLSIGIAIAVFKEQPNHFINLVIFIVETYLLVRLGFHFRDKKSTKYPIIFFASLLLIAAKTVVIWKVSIFGFLGVSYMTFKVLQIIFETYDGIIKEPIGLIVFNFYYSSQPLVRDQLIEVEDLWKIFIRQFREKNMLNY